MDFTTALARAREHSEVVQRIEFALRAEPNNPKMVLGLGSARRRAARSQEDLDKFAETHQVDLVRYRIVHRDDLYAVESVTESLQAFQRSFTGVADFLKSGPKNIARYSAAIEQKSRLNLAYTFAGSLGIVLAVENSRDLFNERELGDVVEVFQQFLEVSDKDQAISASRSLGAALITRLCQWVDVNAKWENSVDFIVKKPTGFLRGEYVDKNRFIDLSDLFHSATDIEPSVLTVTGILVGIDLKLGTFHFVVPGGDNYKGSLSVEFYAQPTTVGQSYKAAINEKVTRVVATGRETRSLSLISLEAV